MQLTAIISLVNIAILAALLIVYTKIYRISKAVYTLGLMFFSIMMMIQNIIGAYAYFAMYQLYSPQLYPYMLGIDVAELIGISILLKITL
ncbi:MAG TPA: hypothetical protein VN704_10860 [Verrucomicrobiae bacterium]|nr:hypothetical protein [Verrucomicrobiae bacterium]